MKAIECAGAQSAWNPNRNLLYSVFTVGWAAAALAISAPAVGQVGHDELIDRIGKANVPTGEDVVVAQVEVANSNGHYAPNSNDSEFVGKTFTPMSGPTGSSGHATTVARHFYGLDTSIAPGIDSIFNYLVDGWIGAGLLRTGAGAGVPPHPSPPDVKIYNNSWVGNAGSATNEILRRADFLAQRDDVLMISGVPGANPQAPLLSHLYNGISVGRSNGSHATDDTLSGFDGPGRMKPELVAPGTATSWTTAVVSAAAALMAETARTPPLDQNPLAERSEVLKAVLLGGAKRESNWTNNAPDSGPTRGVTSRPLDDVFGAGEVNVNTAHLMLTGKQYEGMAAPPNSAHLCRAGWDIAPVGGQESRYWRFHLPQPSQTVSIVATWHRTVSPNNMGAWTLANVNLRLWRVDSAGSLQSLIGTDGEPYFAGGNVFSRSSVDNVELLYIHELEAGDYVIEVQRLDSADPIDVAVAWLMDSAVRHGDLTGDGSVGVPDLLALLAGWGACPDGLPGCAGDLTCSGSVGVADLLLLLSNWG